MGRESSETGASSGRRVEVAGRKLGGISGGRSSRSGGEEGNGIERAEVEERLSGWRVERWSAQCRGEGRRSHTRAGVRARRAGEAAPCAGAAQEPLPWVMHGGPGTGKSFVVDQIRKELFEQELGWRHGIDFQVAALQATNASALDGNAIHSAFGMGVNRAKGRKNKEDGDADAKRKTKKEEAAERMSQWKWLIIDEISMVGANFVAELDSHLRSCMSAASSTKVGGGGVDRPFGGVNVFFCGDFYQLEPPSGTAISALPASFSKNARKYAPGATEDHGQRFFFFFFLGGGGGGPGAVQGMTELTECKRVEDQDAGFLGMQDEFRRGGLTEWTRNF